jgi:hypothetical protein
VDLIMKVFYTARALTAGILEVDAVPDIQDGFLRFQIGRSSHWVLTHKAITDRAEAVKRAEKARLKRIATLKKEVTRLEALKFT